MKKLLNTLYITSENKYLSLDGENVVIKEEGTELGRMPLHNLEMIVTFSRAGASPALMGKCADNNISIVFLTPSGSFLARVEGKTKGNVLLRKKQYEVAADEQESLKIARNTIVGKVYNGRWVIERTIRDHSLQTDADKLKIVSERLRDKIPDIRISNNKDQLRGIEGELASQYFSVFDELILQQKEDFYFHERNRRPPLDRVNALLSFVYTLLTSMMAASLETVGLDPCVGFLHGDRPGRYSLALDMMEELRPALADRFVLRLINKRMVGKTDFIEKEDGAILLTDDARKRVLDEWQKKKRFSGEWFLICRQCFWQDIYVETLMHIRHFCGNRGDILLVLITYDVNTENEAGKSRLRKVAKQCVNYGVRVQNSVFECIVDGAQCRMLKGKLQEIIDEEKDSIRIYYLNDKQKQKIECLGVKKGISVENTLIF